MANKMLIDSTHPEETRVVVVRGNRVEEFDFESASRRQLRGNIYLAKVTRVEPSLQAAFVEYGGNRHGFLAFSEIHPDYYQIPVADRQALIDEEERAHRDAEDEADRRARHPRGRRSRASAARDNVRRGGEPAAAEGDDAAEESLAESHEPQGDHASEDAERARWDAPGHPSADDSDPIELARDGGEPDAPLETDISDNMQGLPPESPATPAAAEAPQPAEPDVLPFSSPPSPADTWAAEPEQAAATAGSEAVRTETWEDERGGAEPAHAAGDAEAAAPESATDEGTDADEDGAEDADEEEFVESVGGADALEEAQERTPRYRRQYKIQEVIKRRQVMLVQVVKEERGTKGAALTTYLSLAGRYCVLMPNTARGGGISRKITSAEDRKRLKEIAQDLDVPEGMGVILRTAGANRTRAEVKRDFEYLLRLWETVRDMTLRSTAPKLVYEEGSLIKRAIRDLYNKDIDEVVVSGDDGYREAKDFMRMLTPSHAKNVKPYKDTQPLFTRSGIESQLDAMFSPIVQLRSGGYVVINQTEALVAIDVNSGRATREHHIEDTALKTNLEAAEEIARQLRLRDLAGLIVIDFIDMDEKRNNRSVERKLKECLKNDRARIQVGRISHFGLLEMSRQRIRSGVLESSTEKCPHCGGTGHVRSISSVTLQLLRALEEAMLKGATHNMIVRTRTDIAIYVLNHKRAHLRDLENRFKVSITVNADAAINGQVPFVVERGEEVHTPEAARAIAQQSVTLVPTVVEEDDLPAGDGDEDGVEARAEGDEAQEPGENGRRRRRRRRRGGRRDEQGEVEGENGERQEEEVAQPATESEHGEDDGEDDEAETREDGDAARAGGEDGARRRRRGRRGGRRNRREGGEAGEVGEPGEAVADAVTGEETAFSGEPETADDRQPESAPTPREAPDGWRQWAAAPQEDAVQPPATPAAAVGADAPAIPHEQATTQDTVPAPTMAETDEAASRRRRSTVREPASIALSGESWQPAQPESAESHGVAAPEPVAASEPPPALAEPEPVAEETGPRRTGWWSRRVFGKG
jgi:ribonuclease E